MANNFRELRSTMSPESCERAGALAESMAAGIVQSSGKTEPLAKQAQKNEIEVKPDDPART